MIALQPSASDLWLISLSDSTAVSADALVDRRDRDRCDRIAVPLRRRGFIFRRFSLRYVLDHYVSDYSIEPNEDGKPLVKTPKGDPPVHFSSSSSGNVCAIAVSSQEVGLDLELSRCRVDLVGIYKQFLPFFGPVLSPRYPEQLLRYLALLEWCRLEAVTKLKGLGLHRLLFRERELLHHRLRDPDHHYAMIANTEYVCVLAQSRPVHLNHIYERDFSKMVLS